MKAAILIPARFASSRYPGKPLVGLKGCTGCEKPLIQRSYEAARRVHNGLIDRRPALIARCHSTADIVDAVKFAQDAELLRRLLDAANRKSASSPGKLSRGESFALAM